LPTSLAAEHVGYAQQLNPPLNSLLSLHRFSPIPDHVWPVSAPQS
jgi:hypothetical protein